MRARWRIVIAKNTRAEETEVAFGESQRPAVQIALVLIEREAVSYVYVLNFYFVEVFSSEAGDRKTPRNRDKL